MEKVFRVFYLSEENRQKLKDVPSAASRRAPFYLVKSFADYRKW